MWKNMEKWLITNKLRYAFFSFPLLSLLVFFHVSRHSWATTAKDEGVAISVISESLGHTSEKVTHVYLASFDNNAMSRANKKVIATIHPNKKKKP